MPWWGWIGVGALIGVAVAAAILWLLVVLSLQANIRQLRVEVCRISATNGHVVTFCVGQNKKGG